MNIPPKKSHSSPVQVLSWPRHLGPLDQIPDIGFQPFLRLVNNKLLLDYQIIHTSCARIVRRHHHPADPQAVRYPVSARDGIVDSEIIMGMIDIFEELTMQGFKDAYNSFYNLKQATPAAGKKKS